MIVTAKIAFSSNCIRVHMNSFEQNDDHEPSTITVRGIPGSGYRADGLESVAR